MKPAGIFRRLAAMFYDALVLLAILLLATLLLMPFTHGHYITSGNAFYQGYLLCLAISFYGGFWLYGGQTLGMLTWRIKIISCDNKKLRLTQCLKRLLWALPCLACFGIGFFWLVFDKDKRTLYDRWSKTKVVIAK
jgi:uncharacterized RDD family membrane protein YckC